MRKWRKLIFLIPAALILVYLIYLAPKNQEGEVPDRRALWFADSAIEKVKGEGKEYWGFVASQRHCVLAVEDRKVNPAMPKGPRLWQDLYISLPAITGPEVFDLTSEKVVVGFNSNQGKGLSLKPGSVKGNVKIIEVAEHSLVAEYTVRLILQSKGDPGSEQAISLIHKAETFTQHDRPGPNSTAGDEVQLNRKE